MNNRTKLIDITGNIIINKDCETVFDYFSNYTNDKFWRKVIHETKINTDHIEKNSIITENSFLSRRIPNYITTFKCIDFQPDKLIICETTAENTFWSKNTRYVEALTGNITKVTYRFQLDINIVKHGLGFRLPTFLVYLHTKLEMKKYLSALKRILEKRK
jgi:hypothetical protein